MNLTHGKQNTNRSSLPLFFTLIVSLLLSLASAQAVLDVQGELNFSDESLEDGRLFDDYYYDGQAGERLAIALFSEAFDVYLLILDPDDNLLFQEDDSAGHSLNVFAEVTLPQTGRYLLAVTSAYGRQTGAYRLTVGNLASVETRTGIRSGIVSRPNLVAEGARFALAAGERYGLADASYLCNATLRVPAGFEYVNGMVLSTFAYSQRTLALSLRADGTYSVSGETYRYSYDPATGTLYWLEGTFMGEEGQFNGGRIRIGSGEEAWDCG